MDPNRHVEPLRSGTPSWEVPQGDARLAADLRPGPLLSFSYHDVMMFSVMLRSFVDVNGFSYCSTLFNRALGPIEFSASQQCVRSGPHRVLRPCPSADPQIL